MSRPYYARTTNYRAGIQSAYDAGLSYFPDTGSLYPAPLGQYAEIATAVISIASKWFGGSAVDQARAARVQYFANLAAQGNVAAMQLILGAPPNVSGNEQQMWIDAQNQLKAAAPDVYNAAVTAGAAWLVNSGDTATNYPAMRNFVQTWATQHPLTAAVGAVSGAIGSIFTPTPPAPGSVSSVPYYPTKSTVPTVPVAVSVGLPPVLLYGALAAGAYFLLGRRR